MLIEAEKLAVHFGSPNHPIRAVKDVNLHIDRGAIHGVIGESGSGKSMTGMAMLGLLPAGARLMADRFTYEGRNLVDVADALRGHKISLISQDPAAALNPVLRISRQMHDVLRAAGVTSGAERQKQALEHLASTGLPDPAKVMKSYPHELSGGMQQRVVIAQALATGADFLIADEPTTALDKTIGKQVLEVLKGLSRDRGLTVLMITHDMDVVANCCKVVSVLYKGTTIEEGPVDQILNQPSQAYTRALLAARPSQVKKGDRLATVEEQLADGQQAPAFAPLTSEPVTIDPNAPPAVEVHDLVLRYGSGGLFGKKLPPAVNAVSFTLKAGETLGIVGESGSGKSTILKAILGQMPVESGSVHLNGEDWLALPRREMLQKRARIGVVAQNPFLSLSPRLRIADILAEPMQAAGGFARSEIADRCEALLNHCGLPSSYLKRRAGELSGGQAQRVAIARALTLGPRLMILDEPTSALDVSVQAQILNLLQDLRAELGLSLLMVTHDLGVVRYMSDELLVMRLGDPICYGITDEIVDNPPDAYTRELLES